MLQHLVGHAAIAEHFDTHAVAFQNSAETVYQDGIVFDQ
jgi:hypothetical protein